MLMGAYNRTIDKVDFQSIFPTASVASGLTISVANPCFSPPIEPTGCPMIAIAFCWNITRAPLYDAEDAIQCDGALLLAVLSKLLWWQQRLQFFHCSSVKSPLPPSS